jgi:hypothetical protein
MRIAPAALALVALLTCSSAAHAEIEKVATPCKTGFCFHWWPKVTVPAGWAHSKDYSLHYNFNALAPDGESFKDAATVMYVNAVYRPRVADSKTLADFIKSDHRSFLDETPSLEISEAASLKSADGRVGQSWYLSPKLSGQWERVAYLEEAEYYIVFVISSRSEDDLKRNMQSFEALFSAYRE